MLNKIKTTDADLGIDTGTIFYVTIGAFRFLADEELFSLRVEMDINGEFEFLEEVDLDENEIIVEHNALKRVALNWMFKNVEIVQEI